MKNFFMITSAVNKFHFHATVRDERWKGKGGDNKNFPFFFIMELNEKFHAK